jgi:hypothetical protein
MLPTNFRFIWPSSFRGEDFLNRPIRNKNCLWWPCLLMDRDEMNNLYRGHSIDASYQVSVHLALGFQRRRLKCENLTDDRQRMQSDCKSSRCLWQCELKSVLSEFLCVDIQCAQHNNGWLTMETDLHQQHDKSGLWWCIIVCDPINRVAEKTLGSPMSNKKCVHHKIRPST